MLLGVVAAAHERATFHETETLRHAHFLEAYEAVGVDELSDFQMFLGRLEVLAQREDVDAYAAQVVHAFFYFLIRFAEAEHDAALGAQSGAFGAHEHFEAAVVLGLDAHFLGKAAHRFQVVAEDVRCGFGDHSEVLPLALEIGDQRFHSGGRCAAADGADGARPDVATTVLEIIAVYTGDDAVFHTHQLNAACNACRFEGIHGIGATGGHVAEAAAARTHVAEDHESGRTCAPAFAHVGAVATLANGVQLVLADDAGHLPVVLADGQFHPQPIGFAHALHDLHNNSLLAHHVYFLPNCRAK